MPVVGVRIRFGACAGLRVQLPRSPGTPDDAALAQSAERLTRNEKVESSILSGGSRARPVTSGFVPPDGAAPSSVGHGRLTLPLPVGAGRGSVDAPELAREVERVGVPHLAGDRGDRRLLLETHLQVHPAAVGRLQQRCQGFKVCSQYRRRSIPNINFKCIYF